MPRTNKTRTIGSEENLARRIAQERKGRGLSYADLARSMENAGCAINAASLYKIEKGTPPRKITVDELIAFGKVFGVEDVNDLLVPLAAVNEERARELLSQVDEASRQLVELTNTFLNTWHTLHGLARSDDEIDHFLVNHLNAAEVGGLIGLKSVKLEAVGVDDAVSSEHVKDILDRVYWLTHEYYTGLMFASAQLVGGHDA